MILLPTVLLTGVILAGCGGDNTTAQNSPAPPPSTTSAQPTTAMIPGDAPAETVVITIKDFSYLTPQEVPAGEEITIRNEDDVAHTITAKQDDAFDVDLPPSSEVTFTAPQQAGSYPFYCEYHPYMTGTLSIS